MSASAADVGRRVICADGWRVTVHDEVRVDTKRSRLTRLARLGRLGPAVCASELDDQKGPSPITRALCLGGTSNA
jgi:hypothetical protein